MMAGSPQDSPERDVPEITVDDLKRRLDAGQSFRLVDIRPEWERRIADLPDVGQLHIPMDELASRTDELDGVEPIVVYCRSGSRSERVVRYLLASGYENALNLEGGVLAWREHIDPTLRAY